MKKLNYIALLLCVEMMIALLAGCGGGNSGSAAPAAEPADESADEPAAEPAAEAVVKDTLVVGAFPESTGFDPQNGEGNMVYLLGMCVYENLFTADENGNLSPDLATSWEYSEDGSELTIHLQEGVKFHNGNDFTSEDVLYTVTRLSQNMMWGAQVASVDLANSSCPDDYTVVFALDHYDARLLPTLCAEVGFMLDKDYCEEVGDDGIAQNPMGTGPYAFVKNESGVGITLERFDDYWGEAGAFKNIELRYFADDNTRALEFESGTLDIAVIESDFNFDYIDNGGIDGAYLYSWPTTKLGSLMMGTATQDTLFQNEDLRLAICHAIDVNTLVPSISGNTALVATSSMPEMCEAYVPHIYEYDPDLAREYLAKAGYPDGVSFTITVSQDQANDVKMAEAIQAQLAEVGIDMQVETSDMFSVIMGQVFGSINSSIMTNGYNGDPYEEYKPMTPDSGMALAAFTDEEAIEAINELIATQDEARRIELLQELQDIVFDKGIYLPLYQWVAAYAAHDYIHGLENATFHAMPVIDLTKITIG